MPVLYRGQELTRYKSKEAGRNRSEIDGFYNAPNGERYFIKKPADTRELFCELFVGLLIKEFIIRKLIDADHAASLIIADVIRFEDGSYGLIQPMVTFTELHKLIGTSNPEGNDRDPALELFFGSAYYKTLTQNHQHFGLSTALMYSLLFGAYSVHSSNIVAMDNANNQGIQFGRIDWGDGLRHYGHPDNTKDILYAEANRGLFNLNKLHKDYFLYYARIPGLFNAIASKGLALASDIKPGMLEDIIVSALQGIPEDMLDEKAKKEIATYMHIPSFKNAPLGMAAGFSDFAKDMAKVMHARVEKILHLHDMVAVNSEEAKYYSTYVATATFLQTVPNASFSTVVENYNHQIFSAIPGAVIKIGVVDINQVVTLFNQYIDALASQADDTNIWMHQEGSENIFASFAGTETGEFNQGHAFVSQYREGAVYRHLFSLDPATIGTVRFRPFEKPNDRYMKANPKSVWNCMRDLATAGLDVIQTLKLLQKLENAQADQQLIDFNMTLLKQNLVKFTQCKNTVELLLGQPKAATAVKSAFYPIDDKELASMTGDQLATICLEELDLGAPSPLVNRIVGTNMLWQRTENALKSDSLKGRQDNCQEKTKKLRDLRQTIMDNAPAKSAVTSPERNSPQQIKENQTYWFFGTEDAEVPEPKSPSTGIQKKNK